MQNLPIDSLLLFFVPHEMQDLLIAASRCFLRISDAFALCLAFTLSYDLINFCSSSVSSLPSLLFLRISDAFSFCISFFILFFCKS
jgi:hypothetical protein